MSNSPELVLVASGQRHVGVKDIFSKSCVHRNNGGQFKLTSSVTSLMCVGSVISL